MSNCLFCKMAEKEITPVIIWEDDEIMVFLDKFPIREGHCLIIPKKHYETFEDLPEKIGAKIFYTGQKLARKLKDIYKVERVGFLYAGGDVSHAHAHIVPMKEKSKDLTSAQYVVNNENLKFSSEHLIKSHEELEDVKNKLKGFETF
ncbi:MAG: HIT family protein [Candidatus Muiribacteriota bacterium]